MFRHIPVLTALVLGFMAGGMIGFYICSADTYALPDDYPPKEYIRSRSEVLTNICKELDKNKEILVKPLPDVQDIDLPIKQREDL